jgi:hypothetical protein
MRPGMVARPDSSIWVGVTNGVSRGVDMKVYPSAPFNVDLSYCNLKIESVWFSDFKIISSSVLSVKFNTKVVLEMTLIQAKLANYLKKLFSKFNFSKMK